MSKGGAPSSVAERRTQTRIAGKSRPNNTARAHTQARSVSTAGPPTPAPPIVTRLTQTSRTFVPHRGALAVWHLPGLGDQERVYVAALDGESSGQQTVAWL